MGFRIFAVEVRLENQDDMIAYGELEIDEQVIESVTSEWRSKFYQLETPEDIAGHVAYNMLNNNKHLSLLDGFATFPDSAARWLRYPVHNLTLYCEAREIKNG